MEIPVVYLHIGTLLLSVVVILYADHRAWRYFKGKEAVLSKQFVKWSHRLVGVGLFGMIITGIFLVLPAWEYYLQQPVWYIKMGLVGVLVFNAFAIGKLSTVATQRSFAELTKSEQRTLLFSGALSGMGWLGAALIGIFFL